MTDAEILGERLAKKLSDDRKALTDTVLAGVEYEQYLKLIGEIRGIERAEGIVIEAVKLLSRDGDLD